MTVNPAPLPVPAPPVIVPDGFFDEVAARLETETAEEIADAVITVCEIRGILHPDLDEDPSDPLRAEQLREVFTLLDAVTAAVADGTVVPSRVAVDHSLDPVMDALWAQFAADAADPQAAAAVEQMIATGVPVILP